MTREISGQDTNSDIVKFEPPCPSDFGIDSTRKTIPLLSDSEQASLDDFFETFSDPSQWHDFSHATSEVDSVPTKEDTARVVESLRDIVWVVEGSDDESGRNPDPSHSSNGSQKVDVKIDGPAGEEKGEDRR